MRKKEIKARTIKQDNDSSCFNPNANDNNGSAHNKRAKRRASKRLREIIRKDLRKPEV